MRYASTFLSHSSADKPLVEAVAIELGRRGVVSWLDIYELVVGDSLSGALAEAIKRQATVTIFFTDNATTSEWVKKELLMALKTHIDADLLPVFLGDCKELG